MTLDVQGRGTSPATGSRGGNHEKHSAAFLNVCWSPRREPPGTAPSVPRFPPSKGEPEPVMTASGLRHRPADEETLEALRLELDLPQRLDPGGEA